LIFYAILLQGGSTRGITNSTAERDLHFELDTGTVSHEAIPFLQNVFGVASLDQVPLRNYARYYPSLVMEVIHSDAEYFRNKYGITDVLETFGALVPKQFLLNNKFTPGKYREMMNDLDKSEEDVETVPAFQ